MRGRDNRVLVTGAAGFVGRHLVRRLVAEGCYDVRAIGSPDNPEPGAEWLQLDLRAPKEAHVAMRGVNWVYNLASKVGGIQYIGKNKVDCFSSVLINTNLLREAAEARLIKGYLFASSACVYGSSDSPIKETDQLSPSIGYGQEKAFSEACSAAFSEQYGFPVRIVRPTGIYGPGDLAKGAKDKDHVPAALCRKVIAAKLDAVDRRIEVWGDGGQVRDFVHVSDVVQTMYRLQRSKIPGVTIVNVGGGQSITINGLLDMVEDIAAFKTIRCYDKRAPTGVRSRTLDNSHLAEVLGGWQPEISLRSGMETLYRELWEQAAFAR